MKKITTFKTLLVAIILLFGTLVSAQTTTRFNDGYLTAFKVGAPANGVAVSQTATFTGNTTNGSAVISNIASTVNLTVGMAVAGTAIPAYSTISSINDANTITISANATAAGTAVTISFNSFTGTITSSSTTISNIASTANLAVGMSITGTTIPSGSIIVSIVDATSITINAAATGTGTVGLVINGALVSVGTAITIEEYLPTGVSQTSANYFQAISDGTSGVVVAGSSSSTGAMTRSENGRYLVIPGYAANLYAASSTFTTNGTARTLNGAGTFGAGISATSSIFTAANDLRGAVTDDGTNYWFSGATLGIRYTTDGTNLTTVSTTTTNTRVVNIFNGQLFYSTGSGAQGIYQVSTGKPTVAGTTVSTITAPGTGPYGFAVSPDGLTIYAFGSANLIARFTYSGTYDKNTFTYSGGTWSTASTGFALTAATGVAVDWSGYSFSTGANGAVVYACNPTTIVSGNDNGTSAITTTILRTISGANGFRGLAFSPIKQTVSLGTNSPATGTVKQGVTNAVLYQFNLSADEGNSTLKKLILSQTGTAVLGTDITNFKLLYDANGDGIADAAEITASLATGVVAGSTITFSGISQPYIAQGSSNNYLVIGDISSTATVTNTFIPSIVSDKTLNSVNYTTNLVNAGASFVNIGVTPPTGNALTIEKESMQIPLVRITEVMSHAGGDPLSIGAVDWFEVTNLGSTDVDITGWKMDDNNPNEYLNSTLDGLTSIPAGKCVIFLNNIDVNGFKSFWGSSLDNVAVGTYTDNSLSSGGDDVVLYDASGTEISKVSFGAATTGKSFYWSYNVSGDVVDNGVISFLGTINGTVSNQVTITSANTEGIIGSPGTAIILPITTNASNPNYKTWTLIDKTLKFEILPTTKIEIFALTGIKVATFEPATSIVLNLQKGIYILKTNNTSSKILLK